MKAMVLEIRDRNTFIPVLCVQLFATSSSPAHYLLRRYGYDMHLPISNVMMTRLSGDSEISNDPHFWGDRTFTIAHQYIIHNWWKLNDGDVVDVEYILGETAVPKLSERYEEQS